MIMHRARITLGLALALAAIGPGAAAAQAEAMTLDRERLEVYTRAHLAMNDARDEFHGKVARVHDAEGRLRAREEVEATIDEILTEAEMTREEYDAVTLMISLDGELRATFEEIMEELAEESSG